MVWITRWLVAERRLEWELTALEWIAENGPLSFSAAVWLQTFGTDITLILLVLLTAGIAVWKARPITAATIVLAYAGIDPVVRLGWLLWGRARPDIILDGVAAPDFHSFPSGHTGKTIAVYGVLAFLWMRAAPRWTERCIALLVFSGIALVVPLGRITMGVHWPTDIVAGSTLGLVWGIWLILALRYETSDDDCHSSPEASRWARP